ncbi:MAG: GYD domain-containing protein [Chloroflexota bacterium]|nr:GYD domain-containing protein [Chloroflexota bacterium]
MPLYMMMTKLTANSMERPEDLQTLGRTVGDLIRQEAPEARWINSYALLGPYDYVDIYEAPNEEVAMKVSLAVRNVSSALTETYQLTPYDRFAPLDHEVLT